MSAAHPICISLNKEKNDHTCQEYDENRQLKEYAAKIKGGAVEREGRFHLEVKINKKRSAAVQQASKMDSELKESDTTSFENTKNELCKAYVSEINVLLVGP